VNVEKYNCDTCVYQNEEFFSSRRHKDIPERLDDEPQHMHPCAHGTPIVASAIAALTFTNGGAQHRCGGEGQITSAYLCRPDGTMVQKLEDGKFCRHCGLLHATPEQAAAMYADQRGGGAGMSKYRYKYVMTYADGARFTLRTNSTDSIERYTKQNMSSRLKTAILYEYPIKDHEPIVVFSADAPSGKDGQP
jgi:hypothetical protein